MALNIPMTRGSNSTFSPAGRVPNNDSILNTPSTSGSVGWGGKGNRQMQASNSAGPGQGMGGGGSSSMRPVNEDSRSTMLGTLTLPRPGGGVMGPGRSYPRTGMGGGLDRLGGAPRNAMSM